MRRALVIAGVMLAGLLAWAPAQATAAEAPIRDPKFELHEGGFLVTVKGEISREEVVLTLYRHGEVAYYETPAEITEEGVRARFGSLGELDYTFTAGTNPGCGGLAEGTFEGAFDFTGENGYVTFDAPRASGSFLGPGDRGCKRRHASSDRHLSRENGRGVAEEEASMLAHTAPPFPVRTLVVFEVGQKHRRRVAISAFTNERTEGMIVARGDQVLAPRRDFTWNLAEGTAHLTPPAPFTGSATFERRQGGHSFLRGSLTAPVLGGEPMRLAGNDFHAQLFKGSIID